ncbi:hypothetical protein DL93DRAFT_494789 [Clavulina sp. PMI_390]|nr:hypothetical protein DL93DRAFT_494789 [Clavulina sp. PMI_390]
MCSSATSGTERRHCEDPVMLFKLPVRGATYVAMPVTDGSARFPHFFSISACTFYSLFLYRPFIIDPKGHCNVSNLSVLLGIEKKRGKRTLPSVTGIAT